MNSSMHIPDNDSSMPYNITSCQRDQLRVAVIVEDLRLPLDEGAKKTCFSLISSFIKKGVKVSIFTWYGNSSLENIFPLPQNKFLLGYSFARNLKAQAPDVILYVPSSSVTIGALVRSALIKMQSSNIPVALLNLQYRKLPTFARFFCLDHYIDIIFAQSLDSTRVFHSFGFKTMLLPGGVDHTIFRPVNKEEKQLLRLKYGFQDTDQIVLHTGHCNRGRNVMTLARLVSSGFEVILIASTSTTMDPALLIELRQSGVKVITDFLTDIQHFYQLADCYVFPVFHETSAIDAPLSILEAMACNIPVVTTRFGAMTSMFEAEDGFYYGSNEEEIIDMVKQAIGEETCRTFEKVSAYSWDGLALKMVEALKEIPYL